MVSETILEEYWAVGRRLSREFPGVDGGPFLELLSAWATVVDAPSLSAPVCEDPADDKFFACALASGASVIVSGDRALRRASGYRGIKVVSPRRFVEEFLDSREYVWGDNHCVQRTRSAVIVLAGPSAAPPFRTRSHA